ncbi:MAG: ATP-binding cassette domain-containing protein [Calditrichia bacterium]|nr:ATP-binding cassette domain-containing protein [Calditrichota bacterium]MCB9067882.1 ATP-binding cassette domain-containing protein [Calditrichia bacterium]
MITVSDLSLQFGKRVLFDDVNLKFTRGNCYGVIGANGAGKSTFLKILSGEIESTRGNISIDPGNRMAVLKQNHFEYENEQVLNAVIMGHKDMYNVMMEKDAIYMNPDATEEDHLRAADLEHDFGEMGGWSAESDAAELLSNLGITEDLHTKLVKELSGPEKVKVLLAQALFGNPEILLLDEPTNDLDAKSAAWLSDFLADFKNTVIVVSHDRYFLDMVCTHMVDIDYSKIRLFTGNYTFWYESSQLMKKQREDKNKKLEQKRAELLQFIQRFSANASKSRQATSRKKTLEKLDLEEIQISSRKYPFIKFDMRREPGDKILMVDGVSKRNENGELLFKDVSFTMNHGDRIGLLANDTATLNALFNVLAGKTKPDSGTVNFGQTITYDYLPNDNDEYFSEDNDLDLIDWLRQYSIEKDEQFIRGFLGRMFFSGDEVYKKVSVLSGGEKVRCMLSKIMLNQPNFLLMDEPTNHLDLESVTALNKAMDEFPGCMIFTSHDHQLMQTVANRIIEVTPNGIIDRMTTFDEYLQSEQTQQRREKLYDGIEMPVM